MHIASWAFSKELTYFDFGAIINDVTQLCLSEATTPNPYEKKLEITLDAL